MGAIRIYIRHSPLASEFSAIAPLKALQQVRALCAESDGDVTVRVDDKHASFNFNDVKLVARLVDGEFPDYRSVISDNVANKLIADKKSFLKTVKRVSAISDDKTVVLRIGVAALQLSCADESFGNAVDVVDAVYDGEDAVVSLRAQYLIDAVSHCGDRFEMGFNAGDKPIRFVSAEEDDGYLAVVMPLTLDEESDEPSTDL